MKAEQLPPTQIVVVTKADPTVLMRLDRSAVKTVMFKPVDAEQLAACIRMLALTRS